MTRSRRRPLDGATLRGAAAIAFVLFAANVYAQISGSLSLVSNYRFRGVSLSHNKPAAQLGVAYDDASGWYGGAFGSTVQLATQSNPNLQAVAFTGFAQRLPAGLSWEAGADYSAFAGTPRYNYADAYLGIASENISARLYYSPRYYGRDSGTLYIEINGTRSLLERLRLLAHLGVSDSSSANLYNGWSKRSALDARAGIGIDFDEFNVQLAWVGITPANSGYLITGVKSRNGVVLSLSRSF